MSRQRSAEDTFVRSGGPSMTVVSDSSPLNTLLYMSDEVREREIGGSLIREYLDLKPLVFYVPPVEPPLGLDPNRIHGKAAIDAIDAKIPELMQRLDVRPCVLSGSSKERAAQALAVIYKIFTDALESL
jgi:hypothetical protein